MKKLKTLIILMLTLILPINAAKGWFQDYILLNVNNSGSAHYWIGSDPSFGTQLNNTNWGQVGSLVLTGADMKYWADGGDNRTGSAFYYMVKSTDGATTYIGPTEVLMDHVSIGGNDYQGTKSGLTVNLLSGLTNGVSYKLHIYAKSWGDSGGDSWLTNGGANYVATFTYNTTPPVTISGAKGISDGTGYSTLGAAFAALNSKTDQSGKNISVRINASTTESTTAGLSGHATTSWSSLKIFPTSPNLTITGTFANHLINFYTLASNITIDGSVNGTGTDKSLSLIPLGTSTYSTIALQNDASNNTIKNCIIKAGVCTSGRAAICLLNPTTTGCDNNTITNNDFTSVSPTERPLDMIGSFGTISGYNDHLTISNNNFYDFLLPAPNGTVSSAIKFNAYTHTSTISGNSFYETTDLTQTATATALNHVIYLGATTVYGITVSGNYIGGKQPLCGGAPMNIISGGTGFSNSFIGMGINVSNTAKSIIENNTIKNIDFTNTSTKGGNLFGIYLTTSCTADIDVKNNIIGSNLGNSSIKFSGQLTGSTAYGIFVGTTGTTDVQYNTIGSLEATSSDGTYATNLYGIHKTGTGTTIISNNYIGSSLTTNSLNASSTSTANVQTVIGVNNAGTGSITIENNSISNLTNSCTNPTSASSYSFTNGIRSSAGTLTVSNNKVTDLTAMCANAGNYTNSSITGIMLSGTNLQTISGNTVRNLNNTYSNYAGYVTGIYLGGGTSVTNIVENNFIHSLTATNTNGAGAKMMGVWLYSGIVTAKNNIVSLGANQDVLMYGIYDQGAASNTVNIYNNTLNIYGDLTSGTQKTYALYNAASNNTRDYKNNNLINSRSTTGGSNMHYAIYLPNATITGLDYNNYFVNGAGGTLGATGGTNKTSVPIVTGLDTGSKNLNPYFAISNPLLSDAYYPGNGALTTTNAIGTVTSDFAGATRNATTPTMGALEYGKAVYDGSAWNLGSTPNSSTTDASLTGNYSGAGFTCKNLTVNAGKQTTITSGTLAVNGDFTLKSDANNGTATFIDNGGTLTVTGASKVEQYITAGRNFYFASPVSAATSNVFDAAGTNKMYRYTESTKSWLPEITDNTTALGTNMAGYIANVGSTGVVTFTGGSLNTGAQSATALSYTSGDKAGYHLLGNPYPSYLNWTGATRSNVDGAVWYRTKNTNGTYVFDTFNGTGTNNNGLGAVTANIPPMQAFWVHVTSAGNGSVAFDNDDRSHRDVSNNNFRAPKQNEQKVLRLQVSNGTNSDETLLVFNPAAQNIYDSFDAYKMSNNNVEIPELFTKIDNNEIVINAMSDFVLNQPLALGFRTGKAAALSIKANELTNFDADTRVWLVDNLEGIETDMTEGAIYNFNSESVTNDSRFSIIFKSAASTTANQELMNDNSIVIFKNADNQITINCKIALDKTSMVSVYSIMGQKLLYQQLTENKTVLRLSNNPGVYLITVSNAGKLFTKKIILN